MLPGGSIPPCLLVCIHIVYGYGFKLNFSFMKGVYTSVGPGNELPGYPEILGKGVPGPEPVF